MKTVVCRELEKKSYIKKDLIGHGSFGPIFRDVFQSMPVAVQRVERVPFLESDKQEIWCAIKQDNIEKLCAMISDGKFRFVYISILFPLCVFTSGTNSMSLTDFT